VKRICLVFLASLLVATSGCLATSPPPTPTRQATSQGDVDLLSTATHASVMTMCENWDADADDDGIVVYPSLKDENDETVKFEGVELPVEIRIYDEDESVLFYTGSSSIDSWEDGNFMFKGSGIKIAFEDIDADTEHGVVYTAITLPGNRTLEAKETFARIKLRD